MLKRSLSICLVLCLLWCMAACHSTDTVPNGTGTSDSTTVTTTVPTTATTATSTTVTATRSTSISAKRPTTTAAPVTSTTSVSTTTTATTTATINYDDIPFTPVTSTQEYFTTEAYNDDITGETVHYLFHEPLRNTGVPAPLLIFLHGKGDSVTAGYPGTATPFVQAHMALENQSYQYGAYTLVPSTPLAHEGQWSDFQVFAFKMLLEHVLETYNIDPKRVYISGISMGGFMTCQLVSEMPNTFAAAVPLSGARNMSAAITSHNTAFRIYHVATDSVVDVVWSQQLYQQLTDSGHPNVEYTEYPTGSHISPIYTVFQDDRDAFFSWLFAQRLP